MGQSAAKPLRFTEEEKGLLRSSWKKVMGNRIHFSIQIFLRVFQQIDGSQNYFEQLVGMPLDEVTTHPIMKAHCVRVTAILDTVLLELEDPVTVVEMFRNIARTHYRLGNFLDKKKYDVFGKIFITLLSEELGRSFDSETKKVWTKAFDAVELTLLNTKAELEARE